MSLLFAKVVNNFSYELRCFNILIVHVQYFEEMLQLIFFPGKFHFNFLCIKLIIHYHTRKQRKNKISLEKKLTATEIIHSKRNKNIHEMLRYFNTPRQKFKVEKQLKVLFNGISGGS